MVGLRVYKCRYCGKEFTSLYALAGHIRMSHPKRRRKAKQSSIKAQRSSALLSKAQRGSALKKYVWKSRGGLIVEIVVPERIYNILVEMDKKGFLRLAPIVMVLGYFIKACDLGDCKVKEKDNPEKSS